MADTKPDVAAELPSHCKKELSEVNASLYSSIVFWLKKHGKGIRPKLTEEQKQQLQECFELMDQDGSGAIDADELGAAFKLLGIKMKRSELIELLSEVDHDGSGEVEYAEFLEIMTSTLQRLAEEQEQNSNSEGQIPFALMATAYRRKRLMEGIINGDKEVQAQIASISDKQTMEALQQSKAAEAAATRAKPDENDPKSIHKKHLKRLSQMQIDDSVLQLLGPEERKVLARLASKQHEEARQQSQRGLDRTNTMRYTHFTQSPTHQRLLEMPQVFDLKFSHRTIKLPPAVAAARSAPSSGPLTQRGGQGAGRSTRNPSPGRGGSLSGLPSLPKPSKA